MPEALMCITGACDDQGQDEATHCIFLLPPGGVSRWEIRNFSSPTTIGAVYRTVRLLIDFVGLPRAADSYGILYLSLKPSGLRRQSLTSCYVALSE